MAYSGLELAKAIQARRFAGPLPPWVEHMRVHEENLIETVESGRIVSIWTPGVQFTVPDGYVQGGLISALADGGQALALLTMHESVEFWITVDLHTRFARPIKMGERVEIESKVLNKTRTSAVVLTTFTLPGEKLAAVVTGGWRAAEGRRVFLTDPKE